MKTREDFIKDAEARVYRLINELPNPQCEVLVSLELDHKHTSSDEWYKQAEVEEDQKKQVIYFKLAQAVLVRNGLCDGLPFCPLCGKIGIPEHNGAPLIAAQVCEACNNRKVIPARIREAQKGPIEQVKPNELTHADIFGY